MPCEANVIASHVVLKIKTNDDGTLKLKRLIVVHGNRDSYRDLVRSDSAADDMILVRLVISLTSLMELNMGTADINGAYMQRGTIQREVYVRQPKDCHRKRGSVWKLPKFPYGMAETGRQWLLRVEEWVMGSIGMSRATVVNQLLKRMDGDRIKLLVENVFDELLIGGTTEDIRGFLKEL